MAQRNMSITAGGSRTVRTQSVSGPPVQEFVTVAVLPPRLPEDMATPTGLGPADAFSWDESLNWQHNQKLNEPKPLLDSAAKKWAKKLEITRTRQKANDMPPFMFRKVTYDVWRKHYAKDKDGRYKGTDTPAEDCLLLPEDVERWRLGEPETRGDLWTRGRAALPGYGDAQHVEAAPAYSKDPPPYVEPDSEMDPERTTSLTPANDPTTAEIPVENQIQRTASTFTADGKTTEQVIQAARERIEAEKKDRKGLKGWKNTMKRAGEYATMGSGN